MKNLVRQFSTRNRCFWTILPVPSLLSMCFQWLRSTAILFYVKRMFICSRSRYQVSWKGMLLSCCTMPSIWLWRNRWWRKRVFTSRLSRLGDVKILRIAERTACISIYPDLPWTCGFLLYTLHKGYYVCNPASDMPYTMCSEVWRRVKSININEMLSQSCVTI